MSESVSYTQVDAAAGLAGWAPLLPITLHWEGGEVSASGLLDSGATVNVLPWELGLTLGLDWERLRIPIALTGNLAIAEARAVVLEATVAPFESVRLAFAWTKMPGGKLLLGQINFFREFDVCFFAKESRFEIARRND